MISRIIVKYSFYLWFLRKQIGRSQSLLDLGCGNGKFMEGLSDRKNWNITGVDADKHYLNAARKRNIYTSLIYSDVNTALKNFCKRKVKFDLVFSSQLIEHLQKKRGQEMLSLIEKVARKKIIITTPRGFMPQPNIYFDGNPLQYHHSGWSEVEFTQLGYKIYGVGFKLIWSENGTALTTNKLIFTLSSLISYVLSPLVFLIPSLGAGIIAVKKKG